MLSGNDFKQLAGDWKTVLSLEFSLLLFTTSAFKVSFFPTPHHFMFPPLLFALPITLNQFFVVGEAIRGVLVQLHKPHVSCRKEALVRNEKQINNKQRRLEPAPGEAKRHSPSHTSPHPRPQPQPTYSTRLGWVEAGRGRISPGSVILLENFPGTLNKGTPAAN